jgi:hypothetical protein
MPPFLDTVSVYFTHLGMGGGLGGEGGGLGGGGSGGGLGGLGGGGSKMVNPCQPAPWGTSNTQLAWLACGKRRAAPG